MAKGYDVCTTTIIGWPSMTCLTSIFIACVVTATFVAFMMAAFQTGRRWEDDQ
jgi:hypothetical protein